ncbi:MAG: beta-lactamase family protein [Colwellia sp.]|nr:beta-lactamase family protein [Colwellia sp.]
MKLKASTLFILLILVVFTVNTLIGKESRHFSDNLGGQPDILANLKERMAHYKVPGVSIALLKDFKISWTHTEGVIDLESNHAVDANTVFQSASISKPVFASILMKYRQDNDLNLDVNINSLLKSWQLPSHQWKNKSEVTLRRLLSHSAGTTVHGFAGYASGEDVPSIISLLNGSKPANSDPVVVNIEPGTKFRYSGGGTTLAQLALQDQSQIPLAELAKKILFTPLKMNNSSYSQPLTGKLKENAALPYRSNGDPVKGGAHTYATQSAAGLWTTPSDLLRLVVQIQRANLATGKSIFTKQSIDEMLTPQIDDMGIGFFLEGKNPFTAFSHGGSNEGFRAFLYAQTQSGDGIVIMTNSDSGGKLIDEIMDDVIEFYQWH